MSHSEASRSVLQRQTGKGSRSGRSIAPLLFISPFYILFCAFYVFPIGFSVLLSFNKWDQAGPLKWAGMHNYGHLLVDGVFLHAVANSLVYILGSLFISFFLALPLAMMLNSDRTVGKPVLRVLYFTPVVTPPVAIAIVFNMIFSHDFGLINAFLHLFGVHPVGWLTTTFWSKFSVLVLVAWQWVGLNSLYFLAGLQAIPAELYEAGMLDGCTRLKLIRYITIPSLAPMMIFVLVTTFIGSSQLFDQPFILTKGGPMNSSLSYANELYNQGLQYLHLGYASAMGVLLLVMVSMLAWMQFRVLSKS